MPQKKLLTMCFASIFLSGCTTALTVTDFLFTPIGSGIHVYYTKDEIFAPYVKAEKEFSPDPARVEGIKKQNLKWVQPVNVKTSCKIPIILDPNINRKVYWDGSCKKGYAYGLGREIHINESLHREFIVNHDHSKIEDYGPYILRDYIKNFTVRGYFKGGIGSSYGYANVEKIIDDKRTGKTQIDSYDTIVDIDGDSYKKYQEDQGQTVTISEKGGLRYIGLTMDQKILNYPSDIIMLSFMHETPEDIIVTPKRRILSLYTVNGNTWPCWIEKNHARTKIGGILGDGPDYFQKGKQALAETEEQMNSYYSQCSDLEKKYLFKLRTTEKPKGISERIYYEIENYYSEDLLRRVSNTKDKLLAERLQRAHSQEMEQVEIEKANRAARARSQQQLQRTLDNIHNASKVNMNNIHLNTNQNFDVEPMEMNTPSVYHVQQLNDNIGVIRKVR